MPATNGEMAVSKTTETPYQLDPDQTLKASKALLGHVQAEAKKLLANTSKRSLLATEDPDDEDAEGAQDANVPIWLNLSTKQHIVDKIRLKPGKISVPHSLNTSEDFNICLITTDPQRAVKNVIADAAFPSSLSTKINRVIGITKLQARYKSFEQRRQLASEHDIFLADERIITRLPTVLGSVFYKGTTKRPIPISIAPKKTDDSKSKPRQKKEDKEANVAGPGVVAAQIEKALNSVTVSLRPGTNVSVRVGLASFTPQQLAENVAAVVPRLIEKHVAKGWRNVRAINVKSPTSFAVPIWLSDSLWAEEDGVIENGEAEPQLIEENKDEEKKRKRNPATAKGPQTGARKKNKISNEGDESRKQRLAAQKSKAFDEL